MLWLVINDMSRCRCYGLQSLLLLGVAAIALCRGEIRERMALQAKDEVVALTEEGDSHD